MHFVIAIRLWVLVNVVVWHNAASFKVSTRGALTVFCESVRIHALQTDRGNPPRLVRYYNEAPSWSDHLGGAIRL